MKILNWEANIRKNSAIMLSQTYIYNLSNSGINFFLSFFLVPMFCWCSKQWRGLPLEWLLQHLLMPFIPHLSRTFRVRTKGPCLPVVWVTPTPNPVALSGPWGQQKTF